MISGLSEATANRATLRASCVLVVLAAALAAAANIQLFADGSLYLFEIIVDQIPVIPHKRLSGLVFQIPALLLVHLTDNFKILRLVFSLGYALAPCSALLLSWIALPQENKQLFVWPAFIILLLNLDNHSWVSELIISVQFSCPLILAILTRSGTYFYWIFYFLLVPFLFFLHPTVTVILFLAGLFVFYIDWLKKLNNRYFRYSAYVLVVLALLKAIFLYLNTDNSTYQQNFLELKKGYLYFFDTTIENVFLFVTALVIGLCLLFQSHCISKLKAVLAGLSVINVVLIARLAHNLNIEFETWLLNIMAIILLFCFVFLLFSCIATQVYKSAGNKEPLLISVLGWLVVVALLVLFSQYFTDAYRFRMKTGLFMPVAIVFLGFALVDSLRSVGPEQMVRERSFLVLIFSICYLFAASVNSFVWTSAVTNLRNALNSTTGSCVEIPSLPAEWNKNNLNKIIVNWRLSFTAFVVQDQPPRKILLREGECRLVNNYASFDDGFKQSVNKLEALGFIPDTRK